MWSIAVDILVADRGKLLAALVGVVFSVVLVNVQGGLFLGLIRRAGLLVDNGQAEVWVGHKKMHNIDFPRDIPRRWVNRVRSVPGVKRAEPYLIGFSDMTLPSGGFEAVTVVGVDPATLLGGAWNIDQGQGHAVLQNDGIIVDRCEYEKLEHPRLGEVREIAGHRTRIAGFSDGIMGFLVAPYIFTTYNRAAEFLDKNPELCSYFLVQLEPSADAGEVCSQIQQRLPEAEALPRDEYSYISVDFWMTRTGLGISFGAATLLGLAVGLVIIAQTLYALVLDRIGEFGTLKAIGATEQQVYTILLAQALVMAVIGAFIGLLVVMGIQYAYSTPQVPILVPWWLSLGSSLLVMGICVISSLLPWRRLRQVDPLTILQS